LKAEEMVNVGMSEVNADEVLADFRIEKELLHEERPLEIGQFLRVSGGAKLGGQVT
jgi:hypothetical protein